jgi:FkbM family methyltransferase
MKFIFESIYQFLDLYFHRDKIGNYLLNLNLNPRNIIDVGSHKGESLSFFSKIFPKSRIFAFEPQKSCFSHLKKLSKSKRNIRVFNYALGNKKENKELYMNTLSTTSTFSKINLKSNHYKIKSFLLSNKTAGFFKKEKVQVSTLSFFIKKLKLKKIDLLKIDTEGHELHVLLGLKNNFNKIKVILIEHNFTDYYLNYNVNKISSYLKKNSFKAIKSFKFPFMKYTDEIYINTKILKL